MTTYAAIQRSLQGHNALPLRPENQVMNLERLGSFHQSRLSFMRTLVRRVFKERWDISASTFELDNNGYGTVVYTIEAANHTFSFVIFSNYLSDEARNDRVIATQWDLTMALVEGTVDETYIEQLRLNVPKQEAGRVDSRVFVLSRANRSGRNFNYIVDCLSQGQQPDINRLANVGYLYRTTAVYGSGKLGMADWEKVKKKYPDFSRPFAGEMFACMMIRHFSLMQVEHIAQLRAPTTFKPLAYDIKRYIGIGNSTGLGMAPYLVNHPLLIGRWVEMRELALARIRTLGAIDDLKHQQLLTLISRCTQHTKETQTNDEWQASNNQRLIIDLNNLLKLSRQSINTWNDILAYSEATCSLQGQEMLVSIMLELYPELVDELEDFHCTDELLDLDPIMPVSTLKHIIETRYAWALAIDFDADGAKESYWYRSTEKMEPRLGKMSTTEDPNKPMALDVGYAVYNCYQQLCQYMENNAENTTARFMVAYPKVRGIVRRIQCMNKCTYGDIQANLLDSDVMPMHLLRCKLAFFGVSKFDPKSRLWVRNTMFQGAPLLEDIGTTFSDNWFMPLIPRV